MDAPFRTARNEPQIVRRTHPTKMLPSAVGETGAESISDVWVLISRATNFQTASNTTTRFPQWAFICGAGFPACLLASSAWQAGKPAPHGLDLHQSTIVVLRQIDRNQIGGPRRFWLESSRSSRHIRIGHKQKINFKWHDLSIPLQNIEFLPSYSPGFY